MLLVRGLRRLGDSEGVVVLAVVVVGMMGMDVLLGERLSRGRRYRFYMVYHLCRGLFLEERVSFVCPVEGFLLSWLGRVEVRTYREVGGRKVSWEFRNLKIVITARIPTHRNGERYIRFIEP